MTKGLYTSKVCLTKEKLGRYEKIHTAEQSLWDLIEDLYNYIRLNSYQFLVV